MASDVSLSGVLNYGRRLLAILAIILLAGIGTGRAQEVEATLYGSVTDPAGGAVPEADITVTNQATGVSVTAKSREDGSYIVTSLHPAIYTLSV